MILDRDTPSERRVFLTLWPNVNGHGPYLRLTRWAYPVHWQLHRDLYERWIWQLDLGRWRVSGWWR